MSGLVRPVPFIPVGQVQPERVEWIWEGRLPRGKVVILDGDPGLGKSTLALDIAARVSNGWSMPPTPPVEETAPAKVLIFSAEDGLANTIVPRLLAAEADVRLIHAVVMDAPGFTLPDHIPMLRERLADGGYGLVICDPFVAYLSAKVKVISDQEVRQVLSPLAALAEQAGVTILLIRHLRKASSEKALYLGGGSIGIIGHARVGLAVAPHETESDLGYLAVTKNNLAPIAPTLIYRRTPRTIRLADGSGIETYRIDWIGETDVRADDLLGQVESRPRDDEAVKLLRHLIAQSGSVPAMVAKARLQEAGFISGPYDGKANRFRRLAGLVSKKIGLERWDWVREG